MKKILLIVLSILIMFELCSCNNVNFNDTSIIDKSEELEGPIPSIHFTNRIFIGYISGGVEEAKNVASKEENKNQSFNWTEFYEEEYGKEQLNNLQMLASNYLYPNINPDYQCGLIHQEVNTGCLYYHYFDPNKGMVVGINENGSVSPIPYSTILKQYTNSIMVENDNLDGCIIIPLSAVNVVRFEKNGIEYNIRTRYWSVDELVDLMENMTFVSAKEFIENIDF